MQLDSIRIAIRERDLLDIMDLAMRVFRSHALPITLASIAGCLPLALLNSLLLWNTGNEIDLDIDGPSSYIMAQILLIIWELPLASAPTTLLLGQILFQQKIDARRLVAELGRSLPQLFIFQVVLRGLLTPMMITLLIPYVGWPYLNEVILLERNRLIRHKKQGLSTFGRSRALHSGSAGEFFSRAIAGAFSATGLILAVWLTLWFIRTSLWSNQTFDSRMYTLYLPLAMWIVAAYFNVVRFLSYLDLRIRREGWEIELRLRAEAEKLARPAA